MKYQSKRGDVEMSKDKIDEFEKLTKPLVAYLQENYYPHSAIIITTDRAELLVGEMGSSFAWLVEDSNDKHK